ncbi:hypothetical protein J6590_027638 [Homalodisca vitripennis]|nr:hypothetical protein J6590_027638 [Homalodisca vitripennis]
MAFLDFIDSEALNNIKDEIAFLPSLLNEIIPRYYLYRLKAQQNVEVVSTTLYVGDEGHLMMLAACNPAKAPPKCSAASLIPSSL